MWLRCGALTEGRGPAGGRQLRDETMRMRGDAQQHVFEIVKRRDVDERAALNERIEERGPRGTVEAAGEEPVLATNSDGAELMFGPVVINPEAAVFDQALERRPLIPQIPERVAEWRLRQDDGVEGVAFGGDPLQDGDTLRLPAGAPDVDGLVGDRAFDLIELLDQRDHRRRAHRLAR